MSGLRILELCKLHLCDQETGERPVVDHQVKSILLHCLPDGYKKIHERKGELQIQDMIQNKSFTFIREIPLVKAMLRVKKTR